MLLLCRSKEIFKGGEIALVLESDTLGVRRIVIQDIQGIGPVKSPHPPTPVLGQDILDVDIPHDGA